MKRTFLLFAIIMIVSCLFTSCTVYKTTQVSMLSDYTTEFVGKSHNHIVATLGAPDRQVSDGAGGTILIYEKTTMTSASTSNSVAAAYNVNYFSKTYTPGTKTSTSTSTTEYTSYIHLFISKDGECYAVKTNHTKPVTQVDEKATKRKKVKGIVWGSISGALLIALGIVAGGA